MLGVASIEQSDVRRFNEFDHVVGIHHLRSLPFTVAFQGNGIRNAVELFDIPFSERGVIK
jgi:hypothetical protein